MAKAVNVFRYLQIETRIVDENNHIGIPLGNVLLAHLHISQDSAQVQQHGNETHVSQFAVVLHHRAAHCGHQVAAEKAELRLPVLRLQRLHQVRCVQIATGLTGYQVIFHRTLNIER